MTIDINSPEDRANIFTNFKGMASLCVSIDDESKQAFSLLFKSWEIVGTILWHFCYWNDYYRCTMIVLQAARNINHIEAEAQVLGSLGYYYMERGYYSQSQKCFQESLQKYRFLKNFSRQCNLLRYFAMLKHQQKQWSTALKYCHQAQKILKTKHSQILSKELAFYEADFPNIIGCVYLELRKFPESYEQLHLSLKNYQILTENYPYYFYYLQGLLLDLGQWHFLTGDYEKANYYYQKCLSLSQERKRKDKGVEALISLALLAEAEGDIEEALRLATEAEQVAGTEMPVLRERSSLEKERLKNLLLEK